MKIKKPEGRQLYGKIIEMLGGDRLLAKCSDGRERIIRIPGRLRKRVWVRRGDFVIVEPWSVQSDKRGDLVWKYTKSQAKDLVKNINL